MELAKKVDACFFELNQDVEMEDPSKQPEEKGSPESMNINTLLDEANKLSYSQEQSKKMKMKKHHLNLDEVTNIVKNYENLPFKL